MFPVGQLSALSGQLSATVGHCQLSVLSALSALSADCQPAVGSCRQLSAAVGPWLKQNLGLTLRMHRVHQV